MVISERPREADNSNVLVVCDALTATQTISFDCLKAYGVTVDYWDARLQQKKIKQGLTFEQIVPDYTPDAVILSRVQSEFGPLFVKWARDRGSTIIYHIDDDLLEVPPSLGADKLAVYSDPSRLAILRDLMGTADVVYASTPFLANRLIEHGVEAPVIAGEIYCAPSPAEIATPLDATLPVLGYMGSSSHAKDLAPIVPVIGRLLEERPSLSFELFGSIEIPEQLAIFAPRVRRYTGFRSYRQFVERMKIMGWWVGLAPLEDNPFNLCKADTKWVEYTLSGCAVVASDLPVYARACADGAGLQAGDPDDWYAKISALLDDRVLRRAMVSRAQEKLATIYAEDLLGEQVLAIMRSAQDQRSRRLSDAQ